MLNILGLTLFIQRLKRFLSAKAAIAFSASLPSQFCPSVCPSVCHTSGSVKSGAS